MATQKPTTIEAYIDAAPAEGQPPLRRLRALLAGVAPEAQQVMKWNRPFFIEPRFLFAFSAHRAHLGFNATLASLEPFLWEVAPYETTRMGILKVRYDQPLPENLIRLIAEHRLRVVTDREDDGFW